MTSSVIRTDSVLVRGPVGDLFIYRVHPSIPVRDVPIVFLHPVNLSGHCWTPVAERLDDFDSIVMDSRGHGRSHLQGPFGVEDYAADVVAIVQALELRAIHLVGASLGGSIACAAAAALPDVVRSLIAVGASLEPADAESLKRLAEWRASGSTADLFDSFLEQEVQHGLPASLAAEARRQVGLETRGSETIKDITWNAFAEDARRFAKLVRCPTLVLTGEHDESCPPEMGARMAHAMGAPFEILPGLGHLPMLQAPALLAERLSRFLNGVAAA
jgi:3-oxoadipate enol-lactonase